jgi:hypothetical protein
MQAPFETSVAWGDAASEPDVGPGDPGPGACPAAVTRAVDDQCAAIPYSRGNQRPDEFRRRFVSM